MLSQDYLGLFDTPPDRREIRLGLAIAGLLFAALLLILPLRNIRLGATDAFVPMIDTIVFTSELIIGTLLYAQAAVFRSRALTILGSGYVSAALFFVPHALTFPGAFTANGLLGAGLSTPAWLVVFRRWVFPAAVILYALLKRADSAAQPEAERHPARILWGVLGAVALAASGTLLATVGQDLVPSLFLNSRETVPYNLAIANCVVIAVTIAAMALLYRQDKSVLDLWLLVALFGWLVELLLNLTLTARFTLGFYSLFGMILVSNLVVMVALVAESSRLYARLALSVAARDRERDARLMSMDAVAAAIAHEVGQPLTAVTFSAAASMQWLDREPPNSDMAIESVRATIDAGRRSLDVIKSIRASFAKGSTALYEFSVNDLVRETTSLLDRELAAQKISLQLTLDESLPPIQADRVQIQQVMVNLLTNAIESLAATRRRTRRISIRSAPLDGQAVLLDFSDSGVGITQDKMARIFEPFFTTKSKGMGLGLSLARDIVEDHGGRLWASTGGDHGATFHLQLPSHSTPRQ